MATVIKSGGVIRAAESGAFNFDDMAAKANQYLEQVRAGGDHSRAGRRRRRRDSGPRRARRPRGGDEDHRTNHRRASGQALGHAHASGAASGRGDRASQASLAPAVGEPSDSRGGGDRQAGGAARTAAIARHHLGLGARSTRTGRRLGGYAVAAPSARSSGARRRSATDHRSGRQTGQGRGHGFGQSVARRMSGRDTVRRGRPECSRRSLPGSRKSCFKDSY